VRSYFETVTLGVFFFKDEEKASLFIVKIKELKTRFILLHLILVTLALNFPIMLVIARLSPYQMYSRLYGDSFLQMLPDEMGQMLNLGEGNIGDDETRIEEFNMLMYQNDFGKFALSIIGMAFLFVLILQLVFYMLACFCMGLQRMVGTHLSIRDRLGLLAFSSTLPVFLAALFGLWLPTVHIIVFYFAVIVIGFQRSKISLI
jgi:hypothetical protein